MFIYDFSYLDFPYQEVKKFLNKHEIKDLLTNSALDAHQEGEALLLKLTTNRGILPLSKEVEIMFENPRESESTLKLTLYWQAHQQSNLFPQMQAELEFMDMGLTTPVVLYGNYTPPLGNAGEKLDKMLLHRVAESCIRSFMTNLCKELNSRLQVLEAVPSGL